MIKITEINLQAAYTWGDLSKLKDWNAIRISNLDWNNTKMSVNTGTQVYVEVTVIENTWELLKEYYADWQSIVAKPNWAALKII